MIQQHSTFRESRRSVSPVLTLFATFLIFVFSTKGFSMENPSALSTFALNTEEELAQNWETVIKPFWENQVTEEFITARDNLKLYPFARFTLLPKARLFSLADVPNRPLNTKNLSMIYTAMVTPWLPWIIAVKGAPGVC